MTPILVSSWTGINSESKSASSRRRTARGSAARREKLSVPPSAADFMPLSKKNKRILMRTVRRGKTLFQFRRPSGSETKNTISVPQSAAVLRGVVDFNYLKWYGAKLAVIFAEKFL